MKTMARKDAFSPGIMLVIVVLSGCSIETDVSATKETAGIKRCVDMRDGEKFSFSTDQIKRGQISLDDFCINITDIAGKKRTLCKSHEPFIKCK